MINFLSKWIEGITLAVLIASIFEMLIPNGNLKKYIKVVLGIYVIFSIIAPFVDHKKLYSLDVDSTINEYYKKIETKNSEGTNAKQDLEKIYKDTFEKEIKQAIENKGYVVYKCNVEGIFDAEQKNAGIKKIEITLKSKISENEEDNENKIKIENIEKVEINIDNNSQNNKHSIDITSKDIKELKEYLSKHFEIEKSIIDILN